MKEERKTFKLGELPEGSRLLEYCKQLDEIIRNDRNSFLPFLEGVYEDCKDFLLASGRMSRLPTIELFLVPTHAEYLAIEKKEKESGAQEEEVPIGQTYGFAISNRFNCRVYVDMELHVKLLEHNAATFLIGLIETYFHELLHCAFNKELQEQGNYEIQCKVVEDFLGFKYPSHIKNRKVADYYRSD